MLNWQEKKKESKRLIKQACLEVKEKSKKLGFVQVHNFIFDVLFPTINNPSATIVYLLLYRRSWGYRNQPKVKISHQNIADKVGLSKRGVQDALDWLQDIGLIESKRRFHTDIPEHFVKRPWMENVTIADFAIKDITIVDSASENSKFCYSTMAKFATTETQCEKKIRNTLSLEKFLNSTKILELEQRWKTMLEKERESEKKQLIKLFEEKPDEANLICDAFQVVIKEQKHEGKIKSAIAVLQTNYTSQYRQKAIDEIDRQQKKERQAQIELKNIKLEKQKQEDEDRINAIKSQCFDKAFPDIQEREKYIATVVSRYPALKDFKPLARGLAINAWAETKEGIEALRKGCEEEK